jgi:hypothetical protein
LTLLEIVLRSAPASSRSLDSARGTVSSSFRSPCFLSALTENQLVTLFCTAMLRISHLIALALALALCRPVRSAEASALLPHSLADVCPLLPAPAPPGAAVTFVWPTRGAYVYSSDVPVQLQVLDESGAELAFQQLAVTLHV